MTFAEAIDTAGTLFAILTSVGAAFTAWRAGRQKELADLKDAVNRDIDALRRLLDDVRRAVDELERNQQASRERAAAEGTALTDAKATLTRLEDRLHRLLETRNGHP